MKKIILLLIVFLAGLQFAAAQKVTVTGVVTAQEDGFPVIGASVVEKGTGNGVITDLDGHFSISVSAGATLEFSYLGMVPQSRKITGASNLNIVLVTDAIAISEVVVTAMGVKTEKKRLNFAVQSLNEKDLMDKKATNFVNALQGKVAGLSVTNSSGSPNSGTQVIIRGISSINNSQNNEPLFILDGIPISGRGSTASDINPNDIESVTVLKGAAAAALYGQDAGNGVIMITTKKGQVGKVIVTANTSWQIDTPTRLPKLQTSYAPGSQGFYAEKAGGGWGPLLNEGEQTYDNVNGFLTTGFYQKYDLNLTGGSEKFQAYASGNYSTHKGIVPNDYRNTFGLLLKGTFQPFKELSINVSANITDNTSRGFGATGMSFVYAWPINDDITDYQLVTGYPRFRYYNSVNKYSSPYSPLYGRYNDNGTNYKRRNILSGSAEWNPVKNLNITGRMSYDTSYTGYDGYMVPRWNKSVVLPSFMKPFDYHEFKSEKGNKPGTPEWIEERDKAMNAYIEKSRKEMAQFDFPLPFTVSKDDLEYKEKLEAWNETYGASSSKYMEYYMSVPYLNQDDMNNMDVTDGWLGSYSASNGRSQLFTATGLVTYKLELPNEFSIDFLAGGEMRMSKGHSTSVAGRDFQIPGTYSLQNTNPKYLFLGDRTSTHSQRRSFGYFGEIRADYKGLASLSITDRWDWTSTLRTSPYSYPSITGGLLFSELFNIKSDIFSYGKLRGNYAVVGKDAPSAYLFDRRLKQFATYPDNGFGIDPTLSSAGPGLMPEMVSTWEVGADVRFFNSRTRLDVAYYSTEASNQIVTTRVSHAAGYVLQTRNEGSVRNYGVEFTLEQDIVKNRDFSWVATLNFGLNRSKVVSLPEDVSEITQVQVGDIYPSAFLGESTTSLSGKDYARTEDGKVICDANGLPQINPSKSAYLGDRAPKFRAGLNNTLNYKDWSLSFLFEGRLGGSVVNATGRGLISNGQSRMLEQYRGRQIVFDGVVKQADGSYAPNTTPITLDYTTIINYFVNVSSNFVEDGSYLRLGYVTLGYAIPARLLKKIGFTGLRCSLTANNLFMLTRYTGGDPTCNSDTSAGGTGYTGIDEYPVPSTTSYNFSITATF